MKFEGALKEVILELDKLSWKYWVYSESYEEFNGEIKCLVLDVDNVDLGSDNFIPLEAEKRSYRELISVQDLQSVVENARLVLKNNQEEYLIRAVEFYIENDAYL